MPFDHAEHNRHPVTSKPTIGQAPGKRQEVGAMFDAIAHRYDLLNHLLSLGIDRLWRKKAVSLLLDDRPATILDVATGTADLAIEALRLDPGRIVGVDISEEMLENGRQKVEKLGKSDVITLVYGASEELPFSDATFDAAMVAFGVRNFEDLGRGLQEIGRVLKPGCPLVVLEFSHPRRFPIRQLYDFYFRRVVPLVGRLISKHATAYEYLPDSVGVFPYGQTFLDELSAAGFERLEMIPLTFGIASLYLGRSTR